jgi:hypothetical protein
MAKHYYTAAQSIMQHHSGMLHAISEDLFQSFIELLSYPLK